MGAYEGREIVGSKSTNESMGAGMKCARGGKPTVSLALSLTTDSTSSAVTSTDSGAGAPTKRRRGPVVATSGKGEFVCKTCGRAFASFQALGGHRTSHLRGRHGLELGVVGVARAIKERRRQRHECHICGLGFEMGQALGGHMRRHREEMALGAADDRWEWVALTLLPDKEEAGHQAAADQPPVLLDLFT